MLSLNYQNQTRTFQPPDVNSDDESPSAISPNVLESSDETEVERITREKKNKQKEEQRRQAQERYQSRVNEYNRKRLAREAEEEQRVVDERRWREHQDQVAKGSQDREPEFITVRGHKVYNSPYANI
jgi:hypothetical protein